VEPDDQLALVEISPTLTSDLRCEPGVLDGRVPALLPARCRSDLCAAGMLVATTKQDCRDSPVLERGH
jgi:hypothetical protein